MAIVNLGLARTRDLVVGVANVDPVNSIGFGNDDSPESASDTKLGAGGFSYWKTDTDPSYTLDIIDDVPSDPSWQISATWGTSEAVDTLYELGTSAGSLSGPIEDATDILQGALLYSRKRIGGATGITKTNDIELVGRVKVIY